MSIALTDLDVRVHPSSRHSPSLSSLQPPSPIANLSLSSFSHRSRPPSPAPAPTSNVRQSRYSFNVTNTNAEPDAAVIEAHCQSFVDTLRNHGITTVVFDMDRTLTSKHSQGAIELSSVNDYIASMTVTARTLLPLLLTGGFTVSVATFCDELYTQSQALFPFYSTNNYISGKPLVQALLSECLSVTQLAAVTIITLNPELYRTSTPTQSRVVPALPRTITMMMRQRWDNDSGVRNVSKSQSVSVSMSQVTVTSDRDALPTINIVPVTPPPPQSSTAIIVTTGPSLPVKHHTAPRPPVNVSQRDSSTDGGCWSCLMSCLGLSSPDDSVPVNTHNQSSSGFNSSSFDTPMSVPHAEPRYQPPPLRIAPPSVSESLPSPPSPSPSSSASVSVSRSLPPSSYTAHARESMDGITVQVNDVSRIDEGDDELALTQPLSLTSPSTSPSPTLPNNSNVSVRQANLPSPSRHYHLTQHRPSSSLPTVSHLTSPSPRPKPFPPPPLTVSMTNTGNHSSPSTPSSNVVNNANSHAVNSHPPPPPVPMSAPHSVAQSKIKHFFPNTPKLKSPKPAAQTQTLTNASVGSALIQSPTSTNTNAVIGKNSGTLTQPLPPFAQLVAQQQQQQPTILSLDKPLDQSSKYSFFVGKLHSFGLTSYHPQWTSLSQYPPSLCKSTHLHCIRALHSLPSFASMLLIDDMEENISSALSLGCHGLLVSGHRGLRVQHLRGDNLMSPHSAVELRTAKHY